MRILPTAATLSLLIAAILAVPVGALGQETDGESAAETKGAAADVTLLRTRGESGWRRHVWTLDREHLQRAVADLTRARRLAGGEVSFSQAYLLAYGELVLGNAESGERALAEVQRAAPTYPGLLLLEAFAASLNDDNAAAIERLNRFVEVVEQNDSDPEFRFLGRLHRGAAYADSAQSDLAIADLEAALAIARAEDRKPPSEAVLRLALAHQRVQQFGEAERLVLGIIADDPGNPTLYYNMGLLYGTQNDFTQARRWYLAASERKRDYADPHVKLAFLAWKDAASDPAQLPVMRVHLEAYAELTSTSKDPKRLADAQCGFGTYWFALAEQRAVEGHDELSRRAYQRARDHFEAALHHVPTCVRALSNLVKIGFQMDETDDRIAPLKKRLDALQDESDDSVEAYRSTFC